MAKFFASSIARAILGFLALVLVGSALWFIGPLLALDGLRPLAGVGLRITLIGLMLVLVILWLLEWSLSIVGVVCLCLLVWHAGPLLALGSARPLASFEARAIAIAVMVVVYVVWAVYTFWNLVRNDEAFAARMLRRDRKVARELAADEVRTVTAIVRQSVAQLRQMHLTVAGGTGSLWAGMRRLVEGKRYLYELPWYMVIGTPGAGKTSALLNSGLKFPVAQQMGAASAQLTLARHAGTRNCAWWFTNEAVLIDTAGRYTDPGEDGPDAAVKPLPDHAKDRTSPVPADAPAPSTGSVNAAEWRGFLGVLRQVRVRAPINGALVAVDVAELLGSDDDARIMAQAALLRARLSELREHLGIRFPVYVVLTKTDLLRGFEAYFGSLTMEARTQVWGFTLPWQTDGKGVAEPLAERIAHELAALQQRIADGVLTRLQEEYEPHLRQALYLLPQELRALVPRLQVLLDAVFADSRYDTTQSTQALRGVYFTSAMQYEARHVTADRLALIPRLWKTLADSVRHDGEVRNDEVGVEGARDASRSANATRSYFLTDLLSKVVFPEAHLVKPNLRWEARFRLLRLAGHALVLVVFGWLAAALMLSHASNRAYLADVADKTGALAAGMNGLGPRPAPEKMVEVLRMAQVLPAHPGLDLSAPALSYRYGLYAAEPVVEAARLTYGHLQDRLILPVISQRMEAVMRAAVQAEDSKTAYDALHAYLLLHDQARYAASPTGAQTVREWVLRDWQQGMDGSGSGDNAVPTGAPRSSAKSVVPSASEPGLAAAFGNSAAVVGYLRDMFSGRRAVQPVTARDEALVRQVRAFLDGSSGTERLYRRTKAALVPDAPQDFTLVRALGPQVVTLFGRASGETLEKGVPGFFTYDGYHTLFARRLPGMVAVAMVDDAWVMGRTDGFGAQSASAARGTPGERETAALVEEIRRQYLVEYADAWTTFLSDLRVIGTQSGGSLAFELNVLRQLAAPDSPLTRLGRLAARETTLSRSLRTGAEENKSFFDRAAEQVEKKAAQVGQDIGTGPAQRAQRELVDERFAALREVVTGQSEGVALPGGRPALDGISNLLNEYYTALVIADAAISTGALPPAGVEAATKIRIEAGKLPAPFREVLLGISANGSDKVAQGAAAILRVQAQVQMDRLVSLLALTVGEPCRRNIAGRYPFAASAQEVAVDDFNAMFAAGGAADEYFNKHLATLVDTSSRPWRYKSPALASALVGMENVASGQPPAPASVGPTLMGELLKLLAANGPNPDFFAQVGQIRETYFKEPGAKRMAWKLDVSVQALDASVTELLIDLDGQVQRYAHGPVQALAVQWPGPRGGTMAEIGAQPRIKADTSVISVRGPWALLRLMERGRIVPGASGARVAVEFQFDGRRAVLDVGSSGINPLVSPLLKSFGCPLRSAA